MHPHRNIFLQTWNPESRELVFGCGDGESGVLVSSCGELALADTTNIIKTRFLKSTVERFHNGAQVDSGKVFAHVKALLQEVLHFEDDRLYTLVALWIIGTHGYSMFSHYGYLFAHSQKPHSGKTRLLEVNSHLAFEATSPLNAPTPLTLRENAVEGRTLQLDTLERWREKGQEAFSAAMDLLDAGFRNGGEVQKMVPLEKGGWRKERFLVYAPYSMAAIKK